MASKGHEHGIKRRMIKLFRLIQEQPFRYTKKELAEKVDLHPETMKHYFSAIRHERYELEYDEQYRYGFSQDRPFEELKDLLALSDEEQLLLLQALKVAGGRSSTLRRLSERLSAAFNRQARPDGGYQTEPAWRQVQEPAAEYGLRPQQLSRPYLTKFQILEQARQKKVQVVLVDYRSSNSNEVKDRLVEPFYAKMEDDTLQAYDVDKKLLRHFLLSRIRRIRMTDTPWAYEQEHRKLTTDPFRIVSERQVFVHLRLGVGAYNELIERFPLTKAYIQEDGGEEHVYHFECEVNEEFIGLTNFILGFHHQIVEVVAPDSLRQHLAAEVGKMQWGQNRSHGV